MEGCRVKPIYMMLVESAYVEKTRKNKTTDLWHEQLEHVSYDNLNVMIKKVKGLP